MATVHKRWSNWALGDLQKCGIYFEKKHLRREFKPKSIAAIRGISVHRQAQDSFLGVMDGKDAFDAEEAKDRAADHFEHEFGQGHRFDKDELEEHGSEKKVKAVHKDAAVHLSAGHANTITPIVRPIAVEQKISVTPKGRDYTVSTVIDLVDLHVKNPFGDSNDPENQQEIVRDLKTKKTPPKKNEAEESQQLTFQALGRLAHTKKLPEKFSLDVLWLTAQKKQQKHEFLYTERTMDDIKTLLRRIDLAVEAVNKGVFLPASSAGGSRPWWCSERFCEYWYECPFGAKERVQV